MEVMGEPSEGCQSGENPYGGDGPELSCPGLEIFARPAEHQTSGKGDAAPHFSDSILAELDLFDRPAEMVGQPVLARAASSEPGDLRCRVYGFDSARGEFFEDVSLRIVTATGACVSLQHEVYADDILRIVNWETYTEADFRVVGPTKMEGTRVAEWAVESLHKDRSIWSGEAPSSPREGVETDAGITLQCRACDQIMPRIITRMEVEALDSTGIIAVNCDHCNKATYWTYAEPERRPKAYPPFPAVAPPPRVERVKKVVNTRAHKRLKLNMPILVRDKQGKEEVAHTENVSVGGFAAILSLDLAVGEKLNYICPYACGGQQIEQQAECRWSAPASPGGVQRIYGFRRIL
jgi:hypothetical protein